MRDPAAPELTPPVLVADDQPIVREVLGDVLAGAGFRTVLAPDGEAVLALARRHRPALILLDILPPKTDGYTILRWLRGDPATRDIPVVTLSGYRAPSFALLSRELGAAAHLTKPCSAIALIETVSHVLERAEVVAA